VDRGDFEAACPSSGSSFGIVDNNPHLHNWAEIDAHIFHIIGTSNVGLPTHKRRFSDFQALKQMTSR
jgi:hypothetical protein